MVTIWPCFPPVFMMLNLPNGKIVFEGEMEERGGMLTIWQCNVFILILK